MNKQTLMCALVCICIDACIFFVWRYIYICIYIFVYTTVLFHLSMHVGSKPYVYVEPETTRRRIRQSNPSQRPWLHQSEKLRLGARSVGLRLVFGSPGYSYTHIPGLIPKVDPLQGSKIYTMGVSDSRIGESTFWIFLGVWVDE